MSNAFISSLHDVDTIRHWTSAVQQRIPKLVRITALWELYSPSLAHSAIAIRTACNGTDSFRYFPT